MEVNTQSTFDTSNIYDYINGFFMNPSAFIIVLIVVIIYIIIFSSLANSPISNSIDTNNLNQSSSSDYGSSSNIIIIVIVIMFTFLLIINGLQYFFGFNIMASVNNIFLGNPVIDIKAIPISPLDTPVLPEITYKEQVFNIPGNYYGYNDAKALCSAYGSRLATYNELENSYNSGGEWCNYGWSDGQMALFPTQKTTFNNLQSIKGHENDCGRPGVNGGYMANPHVKFGVNCFGYKPKITSEEEENMQNVSPYPKTNEDILMEQRVDYWKNKLDNILVSPFDSKRWSQ
jgi:hypothetical protein